MARRRLSPSLLAAVAALGACAPDRPAGPAALAAALDPSASRGNGGAEVWLVDQSNTTGLAHGGAIHVFTVPDLMGRDAASAAPLDVIQLAGATAALCVAATGVPPARPHMLFFNAAQTHAVLAFVASGHVVVFDARTRAPVACLRASPGAGGARQAHAAVPTPDDRHIVVANQNGKLLERIDTDYAAGSFTPNPAATLDLAGCTTPNGLPCQDPLLRPDNAPICPIVGAGRPDLAWITLRGGGLLVVDPTATPMAIVGEYDASVVHGNGCGGSELAGGVFVTSGGGTPANLHEFDVYRFPTAGYAATRPPNEPAPALVLSDDVAPRDGHGTVAARGHLWVFDRGANLAELFAADGRHVATVDLAGALSADPSPDLADVAPAGNRIFVSLRGPNPLTGDPHVSTGSTPGLGVIQLEAGGRRGSLVAVVPITNVDAAGVERADPHGIRVRRP